jgi:hypothetical protein
MLDRLRELPSPGFAARGKDDLEGRADEIEGGKKVRLGK